MRCLSAVVGLVLVGCGPTNEAEGDTTASTGDAATTMIEPTGGAPCDADEDCPDRCHAGACVEGCSAEVGCPDGLSCVADECVAPLPAPPMCALSVAVAPFLTVAVHDGAAAGTVGAADFDGDGAPELFAASGGLWRIRLDDAKPLVIAGGGMLGPLATNVGDIDGDGHLDLLPGHGDMLLFGDGAGAFTAGPGPELPPDDGALGDLDGDGRADMVGFMHACPPDAPADSECFGESPARWMRGDAGWDLILQGMLFGSPRNVMVAPLLAGDTPVGVYETSFGWIVLGTFTQDAWPAETHRVSWDEHGERSTLVAVHRGADDRAELLRVATRENGWSWGTRVRATGEFAELPDLWALPGRYHRAAAGDIDQDGDDDVALLGPTLLLLLDREEEPTGACALVVPFADPVADVALADLDGDGPPELILGAKPGVVALKLTLSP